MWPCAPQIVQAYEARPPAFTRAVGGTSSCCAVAAHCSRTRSCVRALWSAFVQLLLTAQGHGHACVHCGLLLCSCCSLLINTVMRACALWSASVQLLLTAQGHGRACVHCGLLLCSCCSLLKVTVMRACALWSASVQLLLKDTVMHVCIVVCFTTYSTCSIARKKGVRQALIWT